MQAGFVSNIGSWLDSIVALRYHQYRLRLQFGGLLQSFWAQFPQMAPQGLDINFVAMFCWVSEYNSDWPRRRGGQNTMPIAQQRLSTSSPADVEAKIMIRELSARDLERGEPPSPPPPKLIREVHLWWSSMRTLPRSKLCTTRLLDIFSIFDHQVHKLRMKVLDSSITAPKRATLVCAGCTYVEGELEATCS